MIRILGPLLLIFPLTVVAQFSYVVDASIPVSDKNGNALTLAWAGGLNASQYNTLDINGDGREDLVIFDRTANKLSTFVTKDNQYLYAGEYENLFPPEATGWILLRDYDNDGRKDLFTQDVFGIKVFRNITEAGGLLTWDKLSFFSGPGLTRSEVILTEGFSGEINLQLQYDDLPSISDIDGDGDLDILAMRFPSGATVEFHKNMSIERYGTRDSLDFKRESLAWGNFAECTCGVFAFNGDDCNSGGGREKHAGGKSLTAIDIDNDGDQDLLFSEASCTDLFLLENTGSAQDASITSARFFPSPLPANFQLFPSAYYEDVDFDGVKDLLETPNIYTNTFPAATPDLSRSNWFYKNTGSNAAPVFSLQTKSFLQNQMIEVGDNAVPAFADYDADGDLDLFISRFTSPGFVGSITLYKNTGTSSEPSFQLETDDYANVSAVDMYNIRMQWIDVTGDGATDLVFSGTSFQTGITELCVVKNNSSEAFQFGIQQMQRTGFTFGRTENAYLTDVNRDGIPDVLVGKSNGSVAYWRNSGPKGQFNFILENESFLGLTFSVLRQNPRCAVGDLNADGKEDLVIGDQAGQIAIISDYYNANDASGAVRDVIYNTLTESYTTHNLGGRVWPEIANIFGADKPAIVVGTVMGGLQVLRHDDSHPIDSNPVVNIYPIPVTRAETLKIVVDRAASMEIFSVLGQRMNAAMALEANVINEFTPTLAAGVYLLRITANKKSTVRRIVVR